ncbi:hypothetical protein ACS18Q_07135 [Vibrio sp. Vf1514]|uniref:hypothetical protein n=1 Tax=Vibrio sp. Vf1514 TaxID=3437381 RepID=UPI003F8B80A5
MTLLLLFCAFLSLPSFASSEETTCRIGDSRYFWWKQSLGEFPVVCSSNDGCRYQFATTFCDDATGYCSGNGLSDGTLCESGDPAPTCEAEDNSAGCDPDDSDDGGETDPDDDWESPIVYDGWVCYTTAEGDYRCQGGISMLDYREQFTKLYDQNIYNLDRIRDNSRAISTVSSKVDAVKTSVESVYGAANATLVETREITKKVAALKDDLANVDVDLSELDPKFDELGTKLDGVTGQMNYFFPRIMEYVAPINGLFGGVNGNIQTLSGTVSGLRSELNNHLTYNDSLVTKNGQDIAQLSNSLSTLSGDVSGLADGLEALSSQISGAGGTGGDVDLSGVESKLQGIQETLDGKGMVGRPFEGQVDFEANGLYGTDAIENLEGEIEQLETQYQEQMEQFKSLFTFDESELADGTYIEHKWTFRFANGQVNSFTSGVFPALLENSSLIAAVLLFLAVLLGIKALTD